eukprot:7649679-Alexandrium_andersonii.AAC.1
MKRLLHFLCAPPLHGASLGPARQQCQSEVAARSALRKYRRAGKKAARIDAEIGRARHVPG